MLGRVAIQRIFHHSHHLMPNINSLLSKLAADETRARSRELFAPAIGRGRIRIRFNGVDCQLKTVPENIIGWSVFRTEDFRTAEFVREANLAERDRYLDLFPAMRLIVSKRAARRVYGVAAGTGEERFQLDGEVSIQLSEEILPFDTVVSSILIGSNPITSVHSFTGLVMLAQGKSMRFGRSSTGHRGFKSMHAISGSTTER